MNSLEAIKTILSNLRDDDIALFTTGFISRYAFSCGDRESNFYMIGSMGLASSVGLGIALNTEKRVFVFDGDGSLLMDMGTMAMVASCAPRNFYHIVLDNEAYESTGGQPSISKDINFASVAGAAGYKFVCGVSRLDGLKMECRAMLRKAGPGLLHIKLKEALAMKAGRVSITPDVLSQRIMKRIAKET